MYLVLLVHHWIWTLPSTWRLEGLWRWPFIVLWRVGILFDKWTESVWIWPFRHWSHGISHHEISAFVLCDEFFWWCTTKNVVSRENLSQKLITLRIEKKKEGGQICHGLKTEAKIFMKLNYSCPIFFMSFFVSSISYCIIFSYMLEKTREIQFHRTFWR